MTSSNSFSSFNSNNGQQKRKRENDDGDDDDTDDGALEDIAEHDTNGFMDDDDEPFKFGATVLPVANLPDAYQGTPQNGMEYLFTVRREERRLPLVTRVRNPYATVESAQYLHPTSSDDLVEQTVENDDIIPSEEWITCFEQRFVNLRKNMRQSTIHIALPDTIPTFPAMRDRDRWWAFLRGDADWEKIPFSQFHNPQGKRKENVSKQSALKKAKFSEPVVVYQESLSWDDTENGDVQLTYQAEEHEEGEEEEGLLQLEEAIKNGSVSQDDIQPVSMTTDQQTENQVFQIREPTPRLLALLDQKFVIHLLKYFTQWIQGHFDNTLLPAPPDPPSANMRRNYEFTPRHGRWIFALLTQLDTQLTSDEISFLRKLVREIFRLIKEERLDREDRFSTRSQTSHMGEVGCWMIVAAVAGVWGQRDLWDDARDALR